MAMRESLTVTVSIDVEEEGLFCGRYRCKDVQVSNVASLARLEPLFGRGIKPTLFCAYPVFEDAAACETLGRLLPRVEIGAHLHHWNTPPIAQNIPASGELLAVPANQAPLQALDVKLGHLLASGRAFLGRDITSFRMGRWDLHRPMLELLARHGIKIDASVRPLHAWLNKDDGPNHFGAPPDPYWIELETARILEAPLTVAPIFGPLGLIPQTTSLGRKLAASLRHWGALALLPVNHPLWLLKLTAMLHTANGGRALSLTWHSSEMMPGGAPHMPNETAVAMFLAKMRRYLDWLEKTFDVTYASLDALLRQPHPVCGLPGRPCDWTWKHAGHAI